MTEPAVKNVLMQYKYIQHLEREIALLLIDYPQMIAELYSYHLKGAKELLLHFDHALIVPKVVYDEGNQLAMIVVNK